jgi:hypothetical protein
MTPDEIKQQIQAIANFIWLTIPGFEVLVDKARTDPDWNWGSYTKYHGHFHIGDLLNTLRQPDESPVYQAVRWNFFVILVKTTLPRAFDDVKEYCNDHDFYRTFSNEPWFEFVRAIRNAFVHDGNLHFNEGPKHDPEVHKRKILASSWRGKKIEASMFGNPVPSCLFDFDDLIRMIDDLNEFVDKLPTPTDR